MDKDRNFLDKIIDEAYKRIYNNKKYSADNILDYTDLIEATNDVLKSAVNNAIKTEIPARMMESLNKDVFLFSALKTHSQLFEASRQLLNSEGKQKPFYQFAQDVAKIKENYNRNYLEAEYEFAFSSAQMASNWNDIQQNEDRYDIQYRTAQDDKVRVSHQPLHGITLPSEDAFWNQYYPPNGWRCRCTAVEVRKGKFDASNSQDAIASGEKATSLIGKDGKNRLEIFRFNPGKQQVIFPPKHPYNKVDGAGAITTIVASGILDFTTKKIGRGSIAIHNQVDQKANDFKPVKISCEFFAKQGSETRIYPKYHATLNNDEYKKVFAKLKGTPYWGKCPDMYVDGKFYEHEGFESNTNPKKALKNMLNRGLKQSSYLIIEDCGVTKRYAENNIRARIKEGQRISEVWIRKENTLELLYKKTEAQ